VFGLAESFKFKLLADCVNPFYVSPGLNGSLLDYLSSPVILSPPAVVGFYNDILSVLTKLFL